MPWGHSAALRVRHVCIALLFAHDTEKTAAAFPLRQFHTPFEIHIRAFTAQRRQRYGRPRPTASVPRPKPRLTMQVLTSPLRLSCVRITNAERSLRVQSETLLRPTTHSQGRGSCGREPRLRLHCSASMLLSCASPPPLRTCDHCRQPPHITPSADMPTGVAACQTGLRPI